jgi:hypothetical protein
MEHKNTSAENEELEFAPYETTPPGMYKAQLEAIDNDDGEFGPTLRFKWKIIEGDEKDSNIVGWCSKKLAPKSKLGNWTKAHLNMTSFDEDFVLKLSTLLNTQVLITLGVEPRKDGTGDRNIIRSIDPVRTKAKKAKEAKETDTGFSDALSGQGIPDPGEPITASMRRVQD